MAFLHLCPLPALRASFLSLLRPLGARPFPPLSWHDATEHQDAVDSAFHAHMLPAAWVATRNRSLAPMEAELLRESPDSCCRVKSSNSMCGACGATMDVRRDACPELRAHLQRFVERHRQFAFGLQPFIPGCPRSELRFFLVVNASAAPGNRFQKMEIVIRTSAELSSSDSSGTMFDAQLYAVVHPNSRAYSALMDQLQQQRPSLQTSCLMTPPPLATTTTVQLTCALPKIQRSE